MSSITPTTAMTPTATKLDLTVFPPTAYIQVKPDKSITHRVVLQYNGAVPILVTPKLRDFTTDGTTGTPVIQETLSFSSVKLANPGTKLSEPLRMEPNTQLELNLVIDPDADILAQEYHLVLLLTTEPVTAPSIGTTDVGAIASGTIASNLILSVSESNAQTGEIKIKDFPMPRLIDSFGQLKIAILAENTGAMAQVPQGTIALHHWQGDELGKWFIFPDMILAHSTRLLRGTTTDPHPLTEAQTPAPSLSPLTYDAPFLLGPYALTTFLYSISDQQCDI